LSTFSAAALQEAEKKALQPWIAAAQPPLSPSPTGLPLLPGNFRW
jgi:hypothetical protein